MSEWKTAEERAREHGKRLVKYITLADRRAAVEKLKEWTRHHNACNQWLLEGDAHTRRCTCGLDAAIAEILETETGETQ